MKGLSAYLHLGIRVDIDDQNSFDGITSGGHVRVQFLHDRLGNLGLGDEKIIEHDTRNSTTNAVVDVGLNLSSGVLESIETLVNLAGVHLILHGHLNLTESVVLGLGFNADIKRLQTQAHGAHNGRGTAAVASKTLNTQFQANTSHVPVALGVQSLASIKVYHMPIVGVGHLVHNVPA